MNARSLAASAVTVAALAAGVAQAADAKTEAKPAAKEKCFGIAKAGKNSCATAVHACAGYSEKDNDPQEWSYVARGSCLKVGGKLATPKAKAATKI